MRVTVTESQIVKVILLMEEILHQLTGSLFHYLQLFLYIPGGSPDFWTINSGSTDRFNQKCWPSVFGDSSMHPYQRTPMGNPSLSPTFSGYLWVITPKRTFHEAFLNAGFFPLQSTENLTQSMWFDASDNLTATMFSFQALKGWGGKEDMEGMRKGWYCHRDP